jgi:CubicO group peptidase (beta-lactamase class C family)
LRGLLSHTAGLTVPGFPGYPPGQPLPDVVQILNGQAPANTPAVASFIRPGEKWVYSGGGYVAAQLPMTETTGKAFPDLMDALVLRPAGMTRSTYAQPLPAGRAGEAATGYFANGQPLPGGRYAYPELAPAGLWTTPSDLARFAITLQDA